MSPSIHGPEMGWIEPQRRRGGSRAREVVAESTAAEKVTAGPRASQQDISGRGDEV